MAKKVYPSGTRGRPGRHYANTLLSKNDIRTRIVSFSLTWLKRERTWLSCRRYVEWPSGFTGLDSLIGFNSQGQPKGCQLNSRLSPGE